MTIKNTWIGKMPIAHRGLHNSEFPENSLPAFKNAIDNGYAIEIDVHLTTDGKIAVFHDETLIRMTGKDGKITSLCSSDLANYKLADSEYSIPLLTELFDLVDGKKPILIEIKNSGKVGALEKTLLSTIKNYTGEVAVQSFNPYSIEYFKIHAPQITRGQLSMKFTKKELKGFIKRFVLTRMILNKKSCPDFIAYDHNSLPSKRVAKTKLPVLAWTVTSQDIYIKVKPYCDNIIFEQFTPPTK